MEDSNALILPCKRKNTAQSKAKDAKKDKKKEDPKISKSKLKKLQKLEVRLQCMPVKWDDLKKKWSCWKRLNQFTGLGFHPRTGVIQMPEQWWDARIRENAVVLEREEDLDFIFANMEPVNFGPNEDGGHEDGRAGAPTQYVNSDNSHDAEDDVPLQHIGSDVHTQYASSASCRRKSSEQSSNAHFWEGFRTVYDDLSSSKKQKIIETKITDAAVLKKAEDDAEYEALMRELLDTGVDPLSEEYMMATEVLENVTRRGAYRPLPSIEAKLHWIKTMYNKTKGQPPV